VLGCIDKPIRCHKNPPLFVAVRGPRLRLRHAGRQSQKLSTLGARRYYRGLAVLFEVEARKHPVRFRLPPGDLRTRLYLAGPASSRTMVPPAAVSGRAEAAAVSASYKTPLPKPRPRSHRDEVTANCRRHRPNPPGPHQINGPTAKPGLPQPTHKETTEARAPTRRAEPQPGTAPPSQDSRHEPTRRLTEARAPTRRTPNPPGPPPKPGPNRRTAEHTGDHRQSP